MTPIAKNLLIAGLILIVILLLFRKHTPPKIDSTIPKTEVKQIAKEAGVRQKDVQTIVKYNTVTETKVVTKVDTFNHIEYVDRWNEVKGDIVHDTVKLDIKTKDSVTVVVSEKKGKTYIDLVHANPNVITNDISHYQVKTRQKKYSLGIGITYGYNGMKWQPVIGVSLTKSLIRF